MQVVGCADNLRINDKQWMMNDSWSIAYHLSKVIIGDIIPVFERRIHHANDIPLVRRGKRPHQPIRYQADPRSDGNRVGAPLQNARRDLGGA